MSIVYINRPTVVVNQRGLVVDGVRPDTTKNQRSVTVTSRRFNSLREFLNWSNKEMAKKSTITYLMNIRPAANGQYDVMVTSVPVPRVRTSSSTSSSMRKPASRNNSPSKTTAVSPNGTLTSIKSSKVGASANTTSRQKNSVNRKSS